MEKLDLKLSWKVYLLLVLVAVGSATASALLNLSEFMKSLFNLPVIGALSGMIVQIFRDQAAHERNILMQQKQQDYSLAVTSHMANVIFDKHVEFCEAYINALTNALFRLWASGPSRIALDVANDLKKVRQDRPTWIPKEIETKLIKFENGIAQIGIAHFAMDDLPPGEERSRYIRQGSNMFKIITGVKDEDSKELKDIAASRVKKYLQGVLGIEELFNLRKKAISEAISRS
jgi:hypothetical protein